MEWSGLILMLYLLHFTFNVNDNSAPIVTPLGIYFNNSAQVYLGDNDTNTVNAVLDVDSDNSYWMMIPHFKDLLYDPNVEVQYQEVSSVSFYGQRTTTSTSTEQSTSLISSPNMESTLTVTTIACSVVGAFVFVGVVLALVIKYRMNTERQPLLLNQ